MVATEKWKGIPDYPGYQAYNMGQVRHVSKGILSQRVSRIKKHVDWKHLTVGCEF